MTTEVTPRMRFVAHEFLHELDRIGQGSSATAKAVRLATYAESFPASYSPHLVVASQELLVALEQAPTPDDLAAAVLKVQRETVKALF